MTDNITNLTLTYSASPGIYWIIGLCLTVAITFLAVIAKSPFVYLAGAICWTACYFETPMQNTLYNVGMGFMIIFCLIAGTLSYFNKRRNADN